MQKKQKPKANTRSPELLSLCGAPELARGIGRRDQEREDLVRSIASSEQNADVPRGVRLLLGVRLSAARMRAYASARVRFLLCSRSHCSSIPKFSGLRRCGFAPEARNFLGTRHAEKMVASMTFMTSKSSRIVVSKVHGVNMGVECAILVTIMQSCDHFTRKLMPAAIRIQPKIRPLRTFNG